MKDMHTYVCMHCKLLIFLYQFHSGDFPPGRKSTLRGELHSGVTQGITNVVLVLLRRGGTGGLNLPLPVPFNPSSHPMFVGSPLFAFFSSTSHHLGNPASPPPLLPPPIQFPPPFLGLLSPCPPPLLNLQSLPPCDFLRQETLPHIVYLHPGLQIGTGDKLLDLHPIQGGVAVLSVASCYRNWVKHLPCGSLRSRCKQGGGRRVRMQEKNGGLADREEGTPATKTPIFSISGNPIK